MTNENPMSYAGAIRRKANPQRAEALRRKRRRALCKLVLEALTTIGLAACFVLCALMMSCIA